MTARLRELAERWADRLDRNAKYATALMPDDSAELAGIVRAYIKRLDADGEGDGVELADNELPGMWSSADFTGGDPDERPHPARSGGVSDAECREFLCKMPLSAAHTPIEMVRAALTHFAKGNTMNKQSIAVPDYVSADDANRLYGENFGIDWVYEGRDSYPSTELFAGTTDQLNALSIRLPDEDRQWCDTHGMEHSVELADGDCEFPSKGERHDSIGG